MSATHVSDVLNKRRVPGRAILNALELERVVTYRPKAQARGNQRKGRKHASGK